VTRLDPFPVFGVHATRSRDLLVSTPPFPPPIPYCSIFWLRRFVSTHLKLANLRLQSRSDKRSAYGGPSPEERAHFGPTPSKLPTKMCPKLQHFLQKCVHTKRGWGANSPAPSQSRSPWVSVSPSIVKKTAWLCFQPNLRPPPSFPSAFLLSFTAYY
jgi:hypothetical protein